MVVVVGIFSQSLFCIVVVVVVFSRSVPQSLAQSLFCSDPFWIRMIGVIRVPLLFYCC
jgi:hypothetical protein